MAKKIENNKENNSGNMVLVDAKLLGQGAENSVYRDCNGF